MTRGEIEERINNKRNNNKKKIRIALKTKINKLNNTFIF
jgi:hypothetical protein